MPSKRILFPLAASAFALSAVVFGAQNQPNPLAPIFPAGVKSVALPADIFDNIPYLPVKINGSGPYSFILDTGNADRPILNEKLARDLNIPLGEQVAVGGAGNRTAYLHMIDQIGLSLGGLGFRGAPSATLPLDLMDPHWGKRKDGLIGGSILSTVIFDIDYAGKTIRFFDPDGYRPPEADIIPIDVYGQPYIQARIFLHGVEKPVEALLMVDTGVRITTFTAPFSRQNNLRARSPKSLSTMTGFGVRGESMGIVGRVKAIEIGSYRIENPVVGFSTDASGTMASDQFSGILGADILHRFRVVFDYPGRRMYLQRTPAFDKPYEFDCLGARLTAEGKALDTFKIFYVADQTPARTAGLLPGDEIRTIDGRKAGEFGWEALRAYFQQPDKEIRLEIARDGRVIPVTLTLRRLV